jgi:hypothetical protein
MTDNGGFQMPAIRHTVDRDNPIHPRPTELPVTFPMLKITVHMHGKTIPESQS